MVAAVEEYFTVKFQTQNCLKTDAAYGPLRFMAAGRTVKHTQQEWGCQGSLSLARQSCETHEYLKCQQMAGESAVKLVYLAKFP